MPYGTIKVDTVTFTDAGVDKSVSISGLVQNPTFSGNITVTGTISGGVVRGGTVSGATVTGAAGQFTTATITSGVFASGTAAAPSITFNGDLDTGLFTGAANTVGIAANGAAVLTVSGTSVGIGTSSPDSLLEISTSTATPQFLISNLSTTIASGGTIGTIDYRVGSSKTVVARLGATADSVNEDGAHIVFENRTAAGALTEKLRITSGGLVGIGTNSPVAQLETVGIVRSYRQVSGATSLLHDWYSDNGGTKILQHEFQAAGNAFHRGNVGIGTTSPNAKLQVNQNTDTATAISVVSASASTTLTTDFPSLFLQNTNTTNNNYNTLGFVNDQGAYSAGIHGIYTDHTAGAQSGAIAFATRNSGSYSERARIDSSGRLLVGTSSVSHGNAGTFINRGGGTSGTSNLFRGGGWTMYSIGGEPALVLSSNINTSGATTASETARGGMGFEYISASEPTRFVIGTATTSSTPCPVTFWTEGTERMRIDSAGNVGIGTTSVDFAQFGSNTRGVAIADIGASNTGLKISDGSYHNYFVQGDNGNFYISHYGADGAIIFGNGSSGNERVRLDYSGRLLVGTDSTTATNAKLVAFSSNNQFAPIRAGGSGGNGFSVIADNYSADESNLVIGVAYSSAAPVFCYSCKPSNTADNTYLSSQAQYATQPGAIRLNSDGLRYLGTNTSATTAVGTAVTLTSRMLINSTGIAWFSSNNTFGGDAGVDYHSFNVNSSGQWVLGVFNDATSGGYGVVVNYPNSDPNGTSNEAYYFIANNAVRFSVRSNGGIANYQANDVNLCDEREKKNIENLQSTWDCLKHWELKKFHYNEDNDTEAKRYGVIAQQIEEHCPEVISEWVKQKAEDAKLDDEGNVIEPAKEEITRMAVKEQQMYWMAIKALQEAQVRIEQLEAKVAALESA